MRLLLDSHALIWLTTDATRLRPHVLEAASDPANAVFVSAATAWELAIKCALGKLRYPMDRYALTLRRAGFTSLPIEAAHGIAASLLPRHHKDPFDRMLIAQARCERLTLVTSDAAMALYDVELLSKDR